MRETNKAKQAFEDYFNLGPGRSLRILHDQYRSNTEHRPPTIQLATIKKWSSEHGWQERIRERETEIAYTQFEAIKLKAIEAGYAYWPRRVKDLIKLAELLYDELNTEDKRWLPDVKQIGGGKYAEKIDIVRFNSPLIEQFRKTLDDISAEMGERVKKVTFGDQEGGSLIIQVVYDDGTDGKPEKTP